jgi:hypothetical protein
MRAFLLALALAGCVHEPDTKLPAGADTDLPPPTNGTTPPPGFNGVGVLASQNVPAGAPGWAQVRAEVVEHDGQRWLVAVGVAQRIKNPSLAKSTAEARARAELARWLKTTVLTGSVVRDNQFDPGAGSAYARVEVPVAADWMPPSDNTPGATTP